MAKAKSNDKLYKKLIEDALKLPIDPAKLQKDKIPIADRIQALKGIPQVEADLNAIEKAERESNYSELHNLKENFYKRYKLPDYCIRDTIPPSAIRIIRPDYIKSLFRPISIKLHKSHGVPLLGTSPLSQNESLITIPHSYDQICKTLDYDIPSDGKHLTVVIDLCKTETEIIAELKNIFKEAKKTVKKSESREKPFKVDKWEVFDMHTKEDMKFTQIARIKADMGKHVHPSYNRCLESWRQAVKRAYHEAEQIYEAVKKESNVK